MPTDFFDKIEVVGTIKKTLSCWIRVLLRNIISHLSLFFVSSPDPVCASCGVDHWSTRAWVGIWCGCTGNCGDDHHSYLYLFSSWSHARGGRARSFANPGHHSRGNPCSAYSSLGSSIVSLTGHWDGAYVSWHAFYGDTALACRSSDWIEFHHCPSPNGSLTSDSWVSSRCQPHLWGEPFGRDIHCGESHSRHFLS